MNNNLTNIFNWNKDYLITLLTNGKHAVLYTNRVIEAFKAIDRKDFLANDSKHLAYQDIDLELGFNETFTRATTLAQIAELMELKEGGKYLDIGTGSGYFAFVMAHIAGNNGEVHSIERIQSLYDKARQQLSNYKEITNLNFYYRDGRNGLAEQAPYDGIHISFTIEKLTQELLDQLKPNGAKLVYPTENHDIRVIERNGSDYTEEIIPGFVFQKGKEGIS